ncbi:hypothetical protein J1614_001092 [Plenodomus biglobosus]|nr:hypothetical protein J1614_001092 [Plenodomus biglobosus]
MAAVAGGQSAAAAAAGGGGGGRRACPAVEGLHAAVVCGLDGDCGWNRAAMDKSGLEAVLDGLGLLDC